MALIKKNSPPKASIANRIANPPHNGAVTHHHDQSIAPQSFRIRNTRNSNGKKLFVEFDFVSLFISQMYIKLANCTTKPKYLL